MFPPRTVPRASPGRRNRGRSSVDDSCSDNDAVVEGSEGHGSSISGRAGRADRMTGDVVGRRVVRIRLAIGKRIRN